MRQLTFCGVCEGERPRSLAQRILPFRAPTHLRQDIARALLLVAARTTQCFLPFLVDPEGGGARRLQNAVRDSSCCGWVSASRLRRTERRWMLPFGIFDDACDLGGAQAILYMRLDLADLDRDELHVRRHGGLGRGAASGKV